MVDILHQVGVRSTPDKVYGALTTIEGLEGWWTTNTTGDTDVGGVIAFRFGPGGFDMEVVESDRDKHVLWKVVDGPAEWIGTTIDWELRQDGDWTRVLFRHLGWREPVEFMHHCSTKWALYLMSLKGLIETGKGAPDPHDVKIDSWN
ncbi:SRPBCC domain-containing protein [Luedemannella flava]|uniref:SRPBCC domain-containing protein n=1 Tax=Luedemannella flava TaxID=349316 RepID=A0ABN2M9R4_9ACTN